MRFLKMCLEPNTHKKRKLIKFLFSAFYVRLVLSIERYNHWMSTVVGI